LCVLLLALASFSSTVSIRGGRAVGFDCGAGFAGVVGHDLVQKRDQGSLLDPRRKEVKITDLTFWPTGLSDLNIVE
jgi:hypothetical protein